MRKKTVKTRRGGGKTKYDGFHGPDIAEIIALKDFLKRISRDNNQPSSYIKNLGSHYITNNAGNERYDEDILVIKQENLFRTNLENYLGCIFNYDDKSAELYKSYLIEILTNCTYNCKMYISSLKEIYKRIEEPEWMVQYDPNDKWEPKEPIEKDIYKWRGNLYWLFEDVDKAVNVTEKKLIDNREELTYADYALLPEQTTTVKQNDTEYSMPFVEGGKRRRSKKRRSKKRRSIKQRRTKKIRR